LLPPKKKNAFRLYDASDRKMGIPAAERNQRLPGIPRVVTLNVARVQLLLVITAWESGTAHVNYILTVKRRVLNAKAIINPVVLAVVDSKPSQVLISRKLSGILDRLITELKGKQKVYVLDGRFQANLCPETRDSDDLSRTIKTRYEVHPIALKHPLYGIGT
jgi:hypothetical protein